MADNNQSVDEIILVGDRVDLVVKAGQVYRALIEDRLNDGPFLVAVPTLRGIPMRVEQNDDIYLVFYRESGRYIAQMKVIGLETRMETRYMWLLQKTLAQRNQRREAFRLPVRFSVSIYEIGEDGKPGHAGGAEETGELTGTDSNARATMLETADTKDISVTGIALITRKEYEPGSEFMLSMKMYNEPASVRVPVSASDARQVKLAAAVKRCIPWRVSGRYNTGMQFIGIDRNTSEELSQFVLTEQQRQIRMRRLGR